MLHCHKDTVSDARKRLVTRGFAAALERKKQDRPSVERLKDGAAEARLIALACSQASEGRTRWTLQLLADKVVIKHLLDQQYPTAKKVILVCDNLNTHKPAALYNAFKPEEARRLLARLEIHYTPKHGSWLNMAEIELAALTRQCLDRRIPNLLTLQTELAAWNTLQRRRRHKNQLALHHRRRTGKTSTPLSGYQRLRSTRWIEGY